MFKQGDCNDILQSKAARVWDIIGWSEIGFGYFISNLLLILFFPQYISFLAIINICALPYTIWSIWYQVKVQQWCTLCLIVQLFLWMMFVINLVFGFIGIPAPGLSYVFVGCLYVIPMTLVNLLIPMFSSGGQQENIKQELRSIKSKEEVFKALIEAQPYYKVEKTLHKSFLAIRMQRTLLQLLRIPTVALALKCING